MKQAILAALERLTEMKPLSPERLRSSIEAKTRGVINALCRAGVGFFILLILFCLLLFVQPSLQKNLVLAILSQGTAALSVSCAALWMTLDILPVGEMLIFSRQDDMRRQRLAAENDLTHVSSLAQQSLPTLQSAKQWICKEIDCVNARSVGVFGSPEKMAIASLAALAWAVWKEGAVLSAGAISFPIQMLLAFLGAAAIGTLFSKNRLAQLAYQRDLLNLAISQVEAEKVR